MPRNCKKRNINHTLQSNFFKPNWIPLNNLDIKEIASDEIEALRLAYIEWLSMIDWASQMWISGPTFNRILNSGITKIADAIINSKAIKIR